MSNIKIIDFDVESSNPFENCVLNREQYGKTLNSIIDSYPDGFVLALNNIWGEGKTTFLRMWQQSLNNLEYRTIYFNAWENDFEDNPLIAIMGELKSLRNVENKELYHDVIKKGAEILKNVAPALLKAVVAKHIDSTIFLDSLENTSAGLLNSFAKDVESYSSRKRGIADFRNSLKNFVANGSNGKTLVFIIDELDRCRPNYSVTLLEQIKHLFTVPNIAFILSIDKVQLGHVVKGVYGSADLDSDEYLRRFIDLEFSLPRPDSNLYYSYLYKYFELDAFFKSARRSGRHQNDSQVFFETCEALFHRGDITLRQQEKIFANFRLALRIFDKSSFVFPGLLLLLINFKILNSEIFEKILYKKVTVEELQSEFNKVITLKNGKNANTAIIHLEAYLAIFYNEYLAPGTSCNRSFESVINSDVSNKETFTSATELILREEHFYIVGIDYVLDKVNLIGSFK